MDPSYQRRGNLWPERHKQLLINSVLNHYDIPKIYVADFTYADTSLKESKKPYAIIDGKQRFMIFFDFLGDQLTLDSTPVQHLEQTLTLSGLTYSKLKQKHFLLAKEFEDYVPTVMSVISDNLEEVQELFIRLNLNVSISGPERRNAMPGPLPQLVRKLSVHAFFRECATFPINRGQDLNAAAKILLLEHRKGFANTKKADLDDFFSSNAPKSVANFDAILSSAQENLDSMHQLFHRKDDLLARQAQLPVYYWLAKTYGKSFGGKLRDFLSEFESLRGVVRQETALRARGQDVAITDPQILQYNIFVRTPDDKSKQESMYRELAGRLVAYGHAH